MCHTFEGCIWAWAEGAAECLQSMAGLRKRVRQTCRLQPLPAT